MGHCRRAATQAIPGNSDASKSYCNPVLNQMISNCIDRVAGNLNDRDLHVRDESSAFLGKPSMAYAIRETAAARLCRDDL
jgi:hypothetical protein